ncbi:MAG TPA: hypothetical protein VK657_03915, partial [Terriglobales bacterium]|nr:hypothetical protein [Terriglobales bacterium]
VNYISGSQRVAIIWLMSKFDWLIVVKGRLMLPIVAKNNATEVGNFVLIYRELLYGSPEISGPECTFYLGRG